MTASHTRLGNEWEHIVKAEKVNVLKLRNVMWEFIKSDTGAPWWPSGNCCHFL